MPRIVIIEDTSLLLEELVDALQLEHFEAFGASNGIAGLQLVREQMPNLVLCDIMLPGLNGYEILQELRENSTTATIPFIFITSLDSPKDIRLGMELGADDYLPKPFTLPQLLSTINMRLEKQNVLEKHLLQTLSQELVHAQEVERHDFARELRDNFGPMLAGVKMLLTSGQSLPPAEMQTRVAEASQLVEELIMRIDNLSRQVRPSVLEDLGLLPALQQFFQSYTTQTQVHVDFLHTLDSQRFTPNVETAVFRVVEEALNNVARHTVVTNVHVQLRQQSASLDLMVEDEGNGFDVEETLNSAKTIGLLSMRELTASLGGHLAILSRRGMGTRIIASLPTLGSTRDEEKDLTPVAIQPNPMPTLPPTPSSKSASWSKSTGLEIPVLLAESHDLIREGLRRLLEGETSFTCRVVGEATHERELLDLVRQHQTGVLVLDLSFGLGLIPHILKFAPEIKLLVISSYNDEAYVQEVLRKGAIGYLLKETSGEELMLAVREVAEGRRFISKALSDRMLESFVQVRDKTPQDVYATLTTREKEVFLMVVQGLRNDDIADRLTISPRTAETHRTNLMRKLGLRTQADLVRFALRRGLISLED